MSKSIVITLPKKHRGQIRRILSWHIQDAFEKYTNVLTIDHDTYEERLLTDEEREEIQELRERTRKLWDKLALSK